MARFCSRSVRGEYRDQNNASTARVESKDVGHEVIKADYTGPVMPN